MELKKYILNTDNQIFTSDKVHDSGGEYKGRMVLHSTPEKYFMGYLKETSDNILDLVELGDLVETPKDIQRVEIIEEDRYVLQHTRTHWIVISKINVIAIYKKQPNGDYKRYEVKEKTNE